MGDKFRTMQNIEIINKVIMMLNIFE